MKTDSVKGPISFETLHQDFAAFFNEVQRSSPKSDHVFFMSIDAEWYMDPTNSDRNIVLSYQIATASKVKTNNIIKYMPFRIRLTLAEIVELGIHSVISDEIYNQLRGSKILVIIISHNFTAEWSVLADRNESYITRRLSLVRGQPITDGHAIKLVINPHTPVNVKVYDTMLLAPASHQSLKKLSTLLGDKGLEKESVSQFYIENMNLYLRDHPGEYEQYALKDTEITLMLFFLLQQALNDLVNELSRDESGYNFKLYRTLASAGVKSFTNNNVWFDEYRKTLKEKYAESFQLVPRSYLGGRNEGYFIGYTNNYPETKNKIWIDIDFTGCYPTAMATCPKIDITKNAKYSPVSYRIDDKVAAALLREKIPEECVKAAREALSKSQKDFDLVLSDIKTKKYSKKIRDRATVFNNDLIEKWKIRWDKAQKGNSDSIEQVSIPGFAKIRFKFPPETLFPCLPVRHKAFGLLYVLEGETVATAAEIMLAIEAGAEIKALTTVEYPVLLSANDGQPVRLFFDHLKILNEKRESYKPGKPEASPVMEKLLKEFTNSFYGKLAQAINASRVYRPATNERGPLGESSVTEACTASLTTSLARAALSATLLGVERFNRGKPLSEQITVISATTDGLLIGLPVPENFTVTEDYYDTNPLKLKNQVGKELPQILERFGCSGLLDEIDRFLPISQMRNSRKSITLKDDLTSSNEILEIKHIADDIISIKTRGQIGRLSTGETVLLARGNLKPPLEQIISDPEKYRTIMNAGGIVKETFETEWMTDNLIKIENGIEDIQTYDKITLKKFTEIYKSDKGLDVTKNIKINKINSDFDWKRKMVWLDGVGGIIKSISPFTLPHKSKEEMLAHRYAVEGIRKKGIVARPEKVKQRVAFKKANLNLRGGEPVAVTRFFLRGMLHGSIQVQQETGSYIIQAEKLNKVWELNNLSTSYPKTWKADDLKFAKRIVWTPCCFNPTNLTKKLVTALSIEFAADPMATMKVIFATEEVPESTVLIEHAITAIINAPKLGIAPFHHLLELKMLPSWETIVDTYSEQLTVEHMTACARQSFIPGGLPPYQARPLSKIFRHLGIPKEYCLPCARSLAPLFREAKNKARNPQERTCTNYFLQALSQSDLKNRELKQYEITNNLARFGVTKHRFYEEKNKTFIPHCLKNTQENIKQIASMAKAIGHDPAPFIDALIEKL